MIFKFGRDAGEKFAKSFSNVAEGIRDRISGRKTEAKQLEVEQKGEQIVLKGAARSQAEAEKAITAAGDTPGVRKSNPR
jgi:osmotically-inducible protein OsmY